MAEKTKRREGGKVTLDGIWLVLTESTGQEGVGFTHSCGTTILAAQVAHPILDGPFPGSGSGKCDYDEMPYCPKCEEEPNFHGIPINENGQPVLH